MSEMMQHNSWSPKVKFCGLVQPNDVRIAVELGVNAIGLVFFDKSPRYVSIEQARLLRALIPATIQAVGLFVNASRSIVMQTATEVGLDVLQFHGDEAPRDLEGWTLPVWRAVRMQSAADVRDARTQYPMAEYYLLDAHVDTYGGAGKTFDWALLHGADNQRLAANSDLILSGGLNSANVAQGIQTVRPAWVDVSSGIQGIDPKHKDQERMHSFIDAVRNWERGIA
jgi:phosphoribosylanthranilate isomerase